MMERTIRVTGKGKLSVKPDMIRLRINIEGMYEEYDETLRKSSDCVEILKDLIEKMGYERKELKTLYFNIDTEYENYQAKRIYRNSLIKILLMKKKLSFMIGLQANID